MAARSAASHIATTTSGADGCYKPTPPCYKPADDVARRLLVMLPKANGGGTQLVYQLGLNRALGNQVSSWCTLGAVAIVLSSR
jgi:hypothetical protein